MNAANYYAVSLTPSKVFVINGFVVFTTIGEGAVLQLLLLYNREMILDWLVNQDAPETHQTAIENFRRSLPSGQKHQVRRRKAS
jgi:hypothetical protein